MNEEKPQTFRIPVLGIEIERRTDFIALTAFVLALIGSLFQLYGFLKDFDVRLFPPELVTLIIDDIDQSRHLVRIDARMAYVNLGQPGYNATISREAVHFKINGINYSQVWQTFEQFGNLGYTLVRHYESDAKPIPVLAGSSVSHETYFMPNPIKCTKSNPDCNKWKNAIYLSDFIKGTASDTTLTFSFMAEVYGGRPSTAQCIIEIDDDLRQNLVINGWASAPCDQP
jgi:hypothetical protein